MSTVKTYKFWVGNRMKNIADTNPKTAFLAAKAWASEKGYSHNVSFR